MSSVHLRIDGSLAELCLDNPTKLNCFTVEMLRTDLAGGDLKEKAMLMNVQYRSIQNASMRLFRTRGWRVIDVSGRAVEENASRILELVQAFPGAAGGDGAE